MFISTAAIIVCILTIIIVHMHILYMMKDLDSHNILSI